VRGLYPIIDLDSLAALKLPVLEFADAVLQVRPAMLQLRAKHLSARDTLALLRALVPRCRAANVELFANDRPDLALLAGCAGVHVGQDDLPVHAVRQFAPDLKVGVSTHDLAQLTSALDESPDYIAFGPIFATRSKAEPDPVVGLKSLSEARARAHARKCPLIAIGGINAENAPFIGAQGTMGAVIAALLPPDGDLEAVAELARELHAALGGSLPAAG
jgi:thiamine-phosphate pyrophosphorylase